MRSKSLDSKYALVYADPGRRLCMLDITIEDKALLLNGVYSPNDHVEWLDLV